MRRIDRPAEDLRSDIDIGFDHLLASETGILGEIDGDQPVLVIASFEEDGVRADFIRLRIECPAE